MKRALAAAGFLLGLALLASPAQAQTGTARGKVVDAEGKPLPDATVTDRVPGRHQPQVRDARRTRRASGCRSACSPARTGSPRARRATSPAIVETSASRSASRPQVPDFKLQPTVKRGGQRRRAASSTSCARTSPPRSSCRTPARLDEAMPRTRRSSRSHADVPEVHLNLGTVYASEEGRRGGRGGVPEGPRAAARLLGRDLLARASSTRPWARATRPSRSWTRRPAPAPRTRKAQFSRGLVLMNAQKTEDAVKAFEAAVAADPTMADAFYWLGSQLPEPRPQRRGDQGLREVPLAEPEQPAAGGGRPGHPGRAQEEVIADRVAAVRERISRAAARASRPAGVGHACVAVSKTFPAEACATAFAAGVRDFGENRVQEAEPKIEALADLAAAGLRWHLVGHLQSNKARRAAALFERVHSVDSLELGRRLARAAQEAGRDAARRSCRSTSPARRPSSACREEELLPTLEALRGARRARASRA